MSKKIPLVLTNGEPEQLQAGDYIGEVDLIQLTNGEAGTVSVGTPVYISANDTFMKAKADASGTVPVIGLVAQTTIATGVSGSVQTDGIMSASTAAWDAVTGGSGGLVAKTKYYLSGTTAGTLTTTPVTSGYSQRVGIAISTTEMEVNPQVVYKM